MDAKCSNSSCPKEIIDLKEEIAKEICAAKLDASVVGVINKARVQKIVEMECRLNDLYRDWAKVIYQKR
ncbi:hypothetical protein KKF19_03605 [Patescibacteria group bacterium]|nr:hypothetical protein [Patescibacteria group bacterium]